MSAKSGDPRSREALVSRREIEHLISEGRSIIIVDGKVLKVDAWLKYHPGGDKAIKHMIGRDATDEVNAYVNMADYMFNRLRVEQATFTRGSKTDEQVHNWQNPRTLGELSATHSRRAF
jgi:cytochrome b involved in lipid metabolism